MLTYLREKTKIVLIIVVLAFSATIFYGIGASFFTRTTSVDTSTIAKVNGEKIDPFLYNQFLNRYMERIKDQASRPNLLFLQNAALNQAIDFILIKQIAQKETRISRKEIEQALDQTIKAGNYKSKDDFLKTLKRQGLSQSKLKEFIKNELIVQKYLYNLKTSTQLDSSDYREVNASHVLISPKSSFEASQKEKEIAEKDALALATEIRNKALSGSDFKKLAQDYSDDPGSVKNGGSLGYFAKGVMVPEFEEAAFALKPGEISDLVKSDFGYHIIKLNNTKLRKIKGKTGAKEIENYLLAEKQEAVIRKIITKQRNKAKIEIDNPMIKANSLIVKGRIPEALSIYNQLLVKDPNNPYIRVMLALTYETIGRNQEAIDEYQRLIKQTPGEIQIYFSLANLYINLIKRDKSKKTYYLSELKKIMKNASIIAGDNKLYHQEIANVLKENSLWSEYNEEMSVIKRIEKKEKLTNSLFNNTNRTVN